MFFREKRENAKIKKLEAKIQRMKTLDYHCSRINENTARIERLEELRKLHSAEINSLNYRIKTNDDFHMNFNNLERRIFKLELMASGMSEEEAIEEMKKVGWL